MTGEGRRALAHRAIQIVGMVIDQAAPAGWDIKVTFPVVGETATTLAFWLRFDECGERYLVRSSVGLTMLMSEIAKAAEDALHHLIACRLTTQMAIRLEK